MVTTGLDIEGDAATELREAGLLRGEKGSLTERPRVKLYLVAVPISGAMMVPAATPPVDL